MSFGNGIQSAVYGALTDSTALMSEVVGVYDNVPQAVDSGVSTSFPYVTIGEDVITEWNTDDSQGCVGSITIHTWSRAKGRKETKAIQGLIRAALARQELTVTGFTFVTVEYEGEQSFLDADGETRHGVSTFRITLDQ